MILIIIIVIIYIIIVILKWKQGWNILNPFDFQTSVICFLGKSDDLFSELTHFKGFKFFQV